MGDNILNKSAMEAIAALAAEIPLIRLGVDDIKGQQKELRDKVVEIDKQQVGMARMLTSFEKTLEKSIDEIPSKCPHREIIARCEDTIGRVKDVENEIDIMKRDSKIYTGINAIWAAAAAAIAQMFGGHIGNSP